MTRNSSYSSPTSEKPRCPICSHIVALSASQCPNCGNINFYKVGSAPRKNTCSSCNGDGKARWSQDQYSKWRVPDKDYCDYCQGRGYTLIYSVIDKRINELSSDHLDVDDSGNGSLRYREYYMPAVKPIHRGKAPCPQTQNEVGCAGVFSVVGFFTFVGFVILAVCKLLNLIPF